MLCDVLPDAENPFVTNGDRCHPVVRTLQTVIECICAHSYRPYVWVLVIRKFAFRSERKRSHVRFYWNTHGRLNRKNFREIIPQSFNLWVFFIQFKSVRVCSVCVQCKIQFDAIAIIGNNLVFTEMCNSHRLDNYKSNKNKRYTPVFAASLLQWEFLFLFAF